jgi:hypothetical protein
MNDRRKKPRRITSDYYVLFDQTSDEVIGRVVDLSAGGAMLITDEPLESLQRCQCRMSLPDFIRGRRFITFELESKWCQFNRVSNWYEVGCEFVDMDHELEEFVNYLIQNWPPKKDSAGRPQIG